MINPPQHVEGLPFSEDWVAEQLLAAPDGVLPYSDLRAAAPHIPGSQRKSSGSRQRPGGSNGSRTTRYVNQGVKMLVREGLVVRSGEYLAIADRPALIEWLDDDPGPQA